LDNVRTDLKNRYDILFEKYGYVTPEKLRDAYLGVDIQKNTVLPLYELKVQQKQNLVDKTIRSTTLSKYTATKNRIAEFIQYQYSKDDIPVMRQLCLPKAYLSKAFPKCWVIPILRPHKFMPKY
jgi:hypothetical protein